MNGYRISESVTVEELLATARGWFDVERTPAGIVIRWKWSWRLGPNWVVGTGCFGTLLTIWILITEKLSTSAFFWILVVVTSLFAYPLLAYSVNRTRMSVEGGVITSKHGPIPWPHPKPIEIAQITQIYVKRFLIDGSTKYSQKRSLSEEIEVYAKLVEGPDFLLVNGPMVRDFAIALEATLEKFLRIDDVPIPIGYRV